MIELRKQIENFCEAVNAANNGDKQTVINASVISILQETLNDIVDDIKRENVNKDDAAIGIFKKHHKRWKGFAKGVNFNLKGDIIREDGLKTYLVAKFPSYKEKIEKKLG